MKETGKRAPFLYCLFLEEAIRPTDQRLYKKDKKTAAQWEGKDMTCRISFFFLFTDYSFHELETVKEEQNSRTCNGISYSLLTSCQPMKRPKLLAPHACRQAVMSGG